MGHFKTHEIKPFLMHLASFLFLPFHSLLNSAFGPTDSMNSGMSPHINDFNHHVHTKIHIAYNYNLSSWFSILVLLVSMVLGQTNLIHITYYLYIQCFVIHSTTSYTIFISNLLTNINAFLPPSWRVISRHMISNLS